MMRHVCREFPKSTRSSAIEEMEKTVRQDTCEIDAYSVVGTCMNMNVQG
jgi:hypothetical protein